MLKQNKLKLFISSLIIIVPAVIGIISDMKFLIITPVMLLAVYWVCMLFTAKDPGNKEQNKKAFGMIFWIMPALSLWVSGLMYAVTVNADFDPTNYLVFLFSLLFLMIGNYMPKIKQNRTLGIKMKSTLSSEYNWYKTHRFAGKIYVAAGVLFPLCAFLPLKVMPFVSIPILLVAVFAPAVYSVVLYKNQQKEGPVDVTEPDKYILSKKEKVISAVSIVAVLAFVAVLMFTGNVKAHYPGDEKVVFESTYWETVEIKYEDIESVEYVETFDNGVRKYGFGSLRMQLGKYQNDELGQYTSICYTQCDSAVIIKTSNGIYAVNRPDNAQTKAIYEEILARAGIK